MVSTFYKHLSPRPGSCIWRQRLHDHLQQRLSHLGMSWAQYSPHCKPLVRQLWWCRNTEIKRSFIWYFQHSHLSSKFFLFHNDAVPLVQLKRQREASFSFTYAVGKLKSSRPPNIEGGNSVSCDWIQSECQDIGPVFSILQCTKFFSTEEVHCTHSGRGDVDGIFWNGYKKSNK